MVSWVFISPILKSSHEGHFHTVQKVSKAIGFNTRSPNPIYNSSHLSLHSLHSNSPLYLIPCSCPHVLPVCLQNLFYSCLPGRHLHSCRLLLFTKHLWFYVYNEWILTIFVLVGLGYLNQDNFWNSIHLCTSFMMSFFYSWLILHCTNVHFLHPFFF